MQNEADYNLYTKENPELVHTAANMANFLCHGAFRSLIEACRKQINKNDPKSEYVRTLVIVEELLIEFNNQICITMSKGTEQNHEE